MKIFGTILLLIFLTETVIGVQHKKQRKKEVMELNMRNGLPHFFEKVLRGDSVKVAYLGGSITAQEGWRVFSLNGFREKYPRAVFSEINAAIGGTASDFGVFRLHDNVLSYGPDLVFVEFAVNDSYRPEEKIIRSMESIVRKIWENNPGTDICFVYTIKKEFVETELAGELPPSVAAMEKVAAHYGIPSVNFGYEVCQMFTDDRLVFIDKEISLDGVQVFSPDGVHPYPETGHRIYSGTLKRSFEKMDKTKSDTPKKHVLPQPLDPNYFLNAKMVDFTDTQISGGWEIIDTKAEAAFSKFNNYLKKLGSAKPGETLSFRYRGKAVGVFDFKGPGAGKIAIEIDGIPKDTIYRFDKYCTYWRISYFLFDNLEYTEHEVVFKVLNEHIDKAAILSKGGNVIKKPEDYRENNWFVGKLLIDGFLLP